MRIARFALALLLCSCVALSAQTAPAKTPKKGDTIVIEGCLRGSSVEQADTLVEDEAGNTKHNDLIPTLTYRLQGGKSVLKELKDKHDHKVVKVKGVLRSELSRSSIGTDVGRTRITIGADPRNPTRGAEQPLPVLEPTSFEGTTVSCGK